MDLSLAAPPAPPALHAGYLAALDALPRYLEGRGYEPMGVDALRAAVARRYAARGVPTTPDQILVTGGAQSAVHLLLDALVGPGDRVVVEHPTYPHAITAIRAAGARPVPVPVGRYGTDLDLLEYAILANINDGEFFIRKAIGWALRELGKTNPDWVRAFAAQHPLSPLSRREALKHLA